MNIHERDGGITIDIAVQPRAAKVRIGPVHGDRLKIAVTAPPVDGAANQAVIEALAGWLGIAKGRVSVLRGQSSRQKTVLITGIAPAAIEERLR